MYKKVFNTSLLSKNPFIKKAGVSLSFLINPIENRELKKGNGFSPSISPFISLLKINKELKNKVFTSFSLRNKGVGEGGGLAVATPVLQRKTALYRVKSRYSHPSLKYALVGIINN